MTLKEWIDAHLRASGPGCSSPIISMHPRAIPVMDAYAGMGPVWPDDLYVHRGWSVRGTYRGARVLVHEDSMRLYFPSVCIENGSKGTIIFGTLLSSLEGFPD